MAGKKNGEAVAKVSLPQPLAPEQLAPRTDPASLGFRTTDEVEPLDRIIGQDRALDALRFGTDIRKRGYNLFCLGPAGTGKYTIISEYLKVAARALPAPDDWCYINNFQDPYHPKAIRLPAGKGRLLRDDMEQLVDELKVAIPAAFESDEYQTRRSMLEDAFKDRQQKAFEALQKDAQAHSILIIRTPEGFGFAPERNGEPIKPEVFNRLPEAERERYRDAIEKLQGEMEALMRQAPVWGKELRTQLRHLNREIVERSLAGLVAALKKKYGEFPQVVTYLEEVQENILGSTAEFLRASVEAMGMAAPAGGPAALQSLVAGTNELTAADEPPSFRRFEVNLLVDNSDCGPRGDGADETGPAPGAPVIYEDPPVLGSLVGRVEHGARFGTMVTDFSFIKAGALHKANGGFLILDARKLLIQPMAWEELKRALIAGEIRIDSLAQLAGVISTQSLEPEPIPLDLKVVLIGEPRLYYLLSELDPDFPQLFKVQVDFGDRMDRGPEETGNYVRLIAALLKREALCPMDAGAVARVIDQSVRLTGDNERLSTRFAMVLDLLRESDYWAGQDKCTLVTAENVEAAVKAQIRRADRIRELTHEQITRGTMLIDTAGEAVGQVNALSVLQIGTFAFGKPSRITARVRLGKGEVVDIERQVELGGPLHSKGVLILSGFLGARFARKEPLALSASLVFEQSYGGVDGDSASSTELYALLSALSGLPIRQNFAVTGSVNQFGQVQAIGGVNEKIEGFFDICAAQPGGLTGEQGVLIPESNIPHLMLRDDVVQACADGKFHVWPVATIEQGIELLTGVPAGEADADGAYPDGTVYAAVAKTLHEFAEAARRFGRRGGHGDGDD